jgi:Secretion system C-terminal sorting domain
MKNIAIILFCFLAISAEAQIAQVIGSSGGQQSTATISIDFTVGEFAVVSWTQGTVQVSEGFQAINYSAGLVTGLEHQSVFSLYPNPAQRFLTVEGDFVNNTSFSITDISGKQYNVPSEWTAHRTIVDVSQLPGALYILTIQDKSGTPHRVKFIKAL